MLVEAILAVCLHHFQGSCQSVKWHIMREYSYINKLFYSNLFHPPWSSTLRIQSYLSISHCHCTMQSLWGIVPFFAACLQLSYTVI